MSLRLSVYSLADLWFLIL